MLLQQAIQEPTLPRLRSDIQLNEAPPEPEGSPAWTLYDPAANKYYKIGWLEFECLTRFSKCITVRELLTNIEKETTLRPDEETIKDLIMFLIQHNLIQATDPGASSSFTTQKEKRQKSWWEKLLHGYLYFTVPLFRPQRFLEKTFPYIRFLFTRQFMSGVFFLLLYGIFLSVQRFDEFATTFMSYLSPEGVMLFIAATIFVKIFHELGHAYTATKYGVPVSTVGIAVMVLYPVLYTETTNAWRLQNRRERVYIAAAGVMAEMVLASLALILWHILTPGLAQSLCFMIAVVSLLASLAVNLNPLMRFDGYYLFSDIVGIDNLQDRSFAFAKWKLRHLLWGWVDEPPEVIPDKRKDFLAAFGFMIWIYRFFLYTGIAILVYHLFFQPLGFILMMVEFGFFLALPIWREMKVWLERFEDIAASRRSKIFTGIFVFMVLLAFVPLQGSIEVPAVIHAGAYARIYSPVPGQIEDILVSEGQRVAKGQILFRILSPQLDYNIDIVGQRLRALRSIRDAGQANPELAKKRMTIDSEIDSSEKELEGFAMQQDQLQIKAPYDGYIRNMDQSIHVGQWVGSNHMIGLVVDNRQPTLSGYVKEQDLSRISAGNTGLFYAEFSLASRYEVVLEQLEQTGTNDIYWSELASVYRGPLPSERNGRGGARSLPRYTLYSAKFRLVDNGHNASLPDFVARGTIRLKARPTNFANLLIKRALSVVIRESGF